MFNGSAVKLHLEMRNSSWGQFWILISHIGLTSKEKNIYLLSLWKRWLWTIKFHNVGITRGVFPKSKFTSSVITNIVQQFSVSRKTWELVNDNIWLFDLNDRFLQYMSPEKQLLFIHLKIHFISFTFYV